MSHFSNSFTKLNDRQKQAATTTEGYVRVIAGAGSGKTNALTHRYAYLVNTLGITSSDILCVTFTNKAAGEMKRRIRQMIGDFGVGRISTFHGFCVQLLREDCHVLQYPPYFHILDGTDSENTIKLCFEKLGITSKQMTVKKAKEAISKFKHADHAYCELLTDPRMTVLLKERNNAKMLEEKIIYEYLYEQRKAFTLDFDDLIIFALHILRHDEQARTKWQQRLQYVMVDEFQDVDKDQYELAKILSGYHKNLFVVGDPDQTIYTWRGAWIEAILDFDKNFPNAQTIVMDVNYRSLPSVINASNALIRKNKMRIDKDLIPHRKGEGYAKYFHAKSQKEEAEWIAKQIKALQEHDVNLSNIAVLYRIHSVARPIEEALLINRLPYSVLSGIPFYQRKEIKDVLCYLRLICSDDDLSFLRIVNVPGRKIGKKRVEFLRDYAEKNRCSFLSALSDNVQHSIFANTGASAFIKLINKYKTSYSTFTVTDLLNALLDESGYEEYLRISGDEDRLNNLAELKQSIYAYETTAGEETSLDGYLQDIVLFTNTDKEDKIESVKLMTIHSAKGLEFTCVFVCGMNEGIFPSQKTFTPEKLEEERRLAYVAFTRAGDMLHLSDSEGFTFDGAFRHPSRFIFDTEEVNLEYLVPLDKKMIEDAQHSFVSHEKRINRLPVFPVGTKIVHEVFGNGEIISSDEEKSCYSISFERITTPRNIHFNTALKEAEQDECIIKSPCNENPQISVKPVIAVPCEPQTNKRQVTLKSVYYNNLIKRVLDCSKTKTWEQAVQEWDVVDCVEDKMLSSSCVCGKENLRYLFTIKNRLTGKTLFPIGSSCIEKFGRADLNETATIREKLFKLLHAIENGDFITLSREHFSRKLLSYLFDNGAFRATSHNRHNPRLDYQFLLDMFNKRDKDSITLSQNKKISAIILNSVKPFLSSMLRNKIK